MGVNKVVFGDETLIDLSGDTVSEETLAEGATAHDASGERVVGKMPTSTVLYTEQTLTDTQKAQARENIGASPEGHEHSEYALADHTHSGYAAADHAHSAADVGLGNVPNVSTNNQTPTYTAASTLSALASGEKLSVAFGKIAKAVSDLISHISNKSNPHGVTASQIGAAASDHTHSGYATSDHGHTPAQAGVTTAWLDQNHVHDKQNIKPSAIELTPTGTGVNNGGYLDFHYNQDSGDYTSRIIEAAKNRIDILASAGVRFSGHLYKSVNNAYWAILGGTSSTNGASLYLYGKDASSDAGAFMLKATSGSTSKVLKGSIDGTLLWDGKNVWHATNKPNGTYSGNGSATSRTVSVGGTGSMLLIYYASFVVFVGSGGGTAINFYDGSVVKFTSSEVKLSGGNLTIASTSQFLNQSGRTYGFILL